MSYSSILQYLAKLSKIYTKSGKKEKTHLLDHACQMTGFHRKSIIRHISHKRSQNGRKGRSGAKKRYPESLLPHIDFLWESMDRISAGRIKAALEDWLPFYQEKRCHPSNQVSVEKNECLHSGEVSRHSQKE